MKYKVPIATVNASKLLMTTLIKNFGGSTEVGNKCGLSRQAINNFETEGYVPLVQVYSIAKTLRLKAFHLSYYRLMEVFGELTPDFELLVKNLKSLSVEDKSNILKVYKKK